MNTHEYKSILANMSISILLLLQVNSHNAGKNSQIRTNTNNTSDTCNICTGRYRRIQMNTAHK